MRLEALQKYNISRNDVLFFFQKKINSNQLFLKKFLLITMSYFLSTFLLVLNHSYQFFFKKLLIDKNKKNLQINGVLIN